MGDRICRFSAVALLICHGAFGATSAQAQRWTEEDVIRLAREQAPAVAIARGAAAAAERRLEAAGLPPDPTLEWEREQLLVGERPSQDVISLSIPLDFSGRQRGERSLSESEAVALGAEAAETRNADVGRALRSFYEGVAAAEKIALESETLEALEEAERVLSRREEEGSAAGMNHLRLSLEVELARSAVATSEARARQAKARLLQILGQGPEEALVLVGNLTTERPAPVSTLMARGTDQESMAELRRAHGLAVDAREAADSTWVPGIELTGGISIERDMETHLGFVAGVSLNLPVFARNRALARATEARAEMLATTTDARARSLQARIRAAHQRLVDSRAEAARFEAATAELLEPLMRAATSGYREGRRSLLELLDVQRSVATATHRRLLLRLQAKLAEVDLRQATGEL